MSLSNNLIGHAIKLLGTPPGPPPGRVASVDLRRAVSAAYYALFHHLCAAAVEQLAPYASAQAANRIHRWFDHTEMKRICREFAAPNLRPPLRDLLGNSTTTDMRTVVLNFIKLQEARHSADYDLEYQITWGETEELVNLAVDAIGAWDSIARSAESNIFILSLLLWKKWELVRPERIVPEGVVVTKYNY